MQDQTAIINGNASGSSYSKFSRKGFQINYDPENNKNNIYARKLNREIPVSKDLFSQNPLTKIMQP